MDCIFCKIANKEIPSTIVYETDTIIAFNDISPQAPVHIIIIPKQHISSPADITKANSYIAGEMMYVAAEIAKQLNLENGYRLVANCKADGGQTVDHLHMHLFAKRKLTWPPG